MHIEFTQANENHVAAIVQLVNSAYRGDSSKKGWTTEADLLDGQRTDSKAIEEIILQEESVILIAEDEDSGELVGCVHLQRDRSRCYLGMLTVQPRLQNQGFGKMLLEESEALAQFWDCKKIHMTVISHRKELISWYERHGYKLTGDKKPFPYGNERFGIPKVSTLEFVVLEKHI